MGKGKCKDLGAPIDNYFQPFTVRLKFLTYTPFSISHFSRTVMVTEEIRNKKTGAHKV